MSKTKKPYEFDLSKPYISQKNAMRVFGVSKRTFRRLEALGVVNRDMTRRGAWYKTEEVLAVKDDLPIRGR